MRTVKEVSRYTGVSVRTLHYYDKIGLLKPTQVTDAGYRLYDDAALRRLQNILLFRELQFPLKEIREILDNPCFDPTEALTEQIRLLEMQRKHIDGLIRFAQALQMKGVNTMAFDAFDRSELDAYAREAKEHWGSTEAYAEYTQKGAPQNVDGMMLLFAQLGTMRHLPPTDPAVQEKIAALQRFITDNYYTCTKEILQSLGEMYVGDERFRQNIDRAGGAGTAAFVQEAILAYCK